MSKFKHAALALAAAGLLSAQAHASEAPVQSLQAMPVAAFSQSDIQGIFEQAGQPMQLAALTQQEMKETDGAAVPAVVYGLMLGGLMMITIQLGIRWHHSGRNHWYIFASGLVYVAVHFAWEKLGLETAPVRHGIDEYLFWIGGFILGCLGAILFGFLEKYCGPEDPRK